MPFAVVEYTNALSMLSSIYEFQLRSTQGVEERGMNSIYIRYHSTK